MRFRLRPFFVIFASIYYICFTKYDDLRSRTRRLKTGPQAVRPETFDESKTVAQQGGNVARVARKELEAKTGRNVVTGLNARAALNERNISKR